MKLGYKLFSEGCGPNELVRQAVRAEEVGFDFVEISDHFHPWLYEPRPLPVRLVGARLDRREHRAPRAVDGRHLPIDPLPPGDRRPGGGDRRACSRTGASRSGSARASSSTSTSSAAAGPRSPSATRSFARRSRSSACSGRAATSPTRASTCSSRTPACSTSPRRRRRSSSRSAGPRAAAIAAEHGDGIFATDPDREARRAPTGTPAGRGQVRGGPARLGPDEDSAARSAHARFRFGLLGWKVLAELPNPINFEAASEFITVDAVREVFACGPDVERHLEVARQFAGAGFDHLALINAGPDPDGFFDFFAAELAAPLREL